ncbi:chromosome segregation protein SMC [Halobacteria archaeon AArc-xg1-1]|uniref:Chromosome segregation protein SMC n=1 Tax=Natronoglomus mannanivorans TaxID=2979990 RepID=A0AAP3E4U6_9EURY|nr:chromosome segregation protein SMC [Halobacteria archaeon AArc-xg1-1]
MDTFSTLLETNDARRAVERGDDIRNVLMRPVDTNQLEAQIRKQQRKRSDLRERYQEIEREIERETELTEQREALTSEIEELDAEIEELRVQVDEYEAGEDMAEEAESLVNNLEAKREEKRSLQNDIEVLEAEREGVLEEESELEAEHEELYEEYLSETGSDGDTGDVENTTDTRINELESRIGDLQARKDELNTTIDDLTRIIQINQQAVENAADLPGVTPTDTDGDVTAALDPSSQEIECWTCGSTVEQNVIDERTSELQDLVSEKRDRVSEITREIDELRERVSALRETRRSRENITERLQQIETEKIALSDQIQEKEQAIRGVEDEIEELQEDVAETEELRESDLLDAYQELNELQYELGRKESQIDEIDASLDDITEFRDEREDLETEIDEVTATLEQLRTRVADMERDVVDAFNTHMETILDRLAYENIVRVWIERRIPENQRGEFETGEFELHIVRESSDGAAYEDTIDTLSESEREVTGLVVALAGYLVHDVAEYVPFILLDSVEAVDANRLVDLVEYFAEHTAFLTIALLPEDAAVFPDDLHRVTADELAP